MFADNHKLSTNGIWKLLLTEETGLALLFSVYFAKRLDILTGAMILTGIFVLWVKKLALRSYTT